MCLSTYFWQHAVPFLAHSFLFLLPVNFQFILVFVHLVYSYYKVL